MASITTDKSGKRRVVFMLDGRRKVLHLGKTAKTKAERIKARVEDLVSAARSGHRPEDRTVEWLSGLTDDLHKKLVAVGLAKPRGSASIGGFTREFIERRHDIKPNTRINFERVRSYLLEFFDADKALRDIGPADAEDFHQHLVKRGLADNTIARSLGRARQFFRAAMRRELVTRNPFDGDAFKVSVKPVMDRFHFVTRQDAAKMLDACPDAEWRLIFSLARYGGLRVPSELLALTWTDINWAEQRIRVPSPKTERHAGGESRIIPLFPELEGPLREVFEAAEEGSVHVIRRYRDTNANLRTQLHRIIRKAGLVPWPKCFQNLRSTRETELAETYPIHVVCRWIGNSQPIAAKHYLQLTDEHFERAVAGPATGKAIERPDEARTTR